MSKAHYDVIVIGSGLGGLICASILAREGRKVLVLEKNNQLGGNLQTFSRDKCIFDTGVHYLGGLGQGQNLHQYFSFLGIMDQLKIEPLDQDAFDQISFDNDNRIFSYAQTAENFISKLSKQFPDEAENIHKFYELMEACCQSFPLYYLNNNVGYKDLLPEAGKPINEVIESITNNPTLQAVLAGTNLLYAGQAGHTPFYVHALSVNSYISSAWRCIGGGSQISKLLARQIRHHGGKILKYQEIIRIETQDKKVIAVHSRDGSSHTGDIFISNINPKRLLSLMKEPPIRKASIRRIQEARDTISSFSVFIVLKPGLIPYVNHNIYHFKSKEQVWGAIDYHEEDWPGGFMLSMTPDPKDNKWAQSITAFTYMRFEEVEKWANSMSTVSNPEPRDPDYLNFKQQKTEALLAAIEKKFPNIRQHIQSIYTATPLTYRDYIGNLTGDMYGFAKTAGEVQKNILPVKTKLDNLYQTGQHISMHGIVGVTTSAILTCAELLGMDYLMNRIYSGYNREET